jgi:CubicO group peptidase (beta-lactamase class C family)
VSDVAARVEAVVNEQASTLRVGGAVAGVDVAGARAFAAGGIANLGTGQPFAPDTRWLIGSITKVLTATILLRAVERGDLDLDASVQRYVPEFGLRDRDAADAITVRMLLNHTNGIDADGLGPPTRPGLTTSRSYTDALPDRGVLFEPGRCLHYGNPGFVLAARLVEESTGLPFERAMETELFGPAALRDSVLLADGRLPDPSAVGAVASDSGLVSASRLTNPPSRAGSGSTCLSTVSDVLAFGRMHLADGVAPNGHRVLSAETVRLMREPSYDLGIEPAPPVGLAWWLLPIGGTTALTHAGGSPGATSTLCLFPEHDTVCVSFATGPDSQLVNDLVHSAVAEELTGTPPPQPYAGPVSPGTRRAATGEYRSFQKRVVVESRHDELAVSTTIEPYDETHREQHERHTGSGATYATVCYRETAPGLLAPASYWPGFFGRIQLLALVQQAPGRGPGLHTGLRYVPKVTG